MRLCGVRRDMNAVYLPFVLVPCRFVSIMHMQREQYKNILKRDMDALYQAVHIIASHRISEHLVASHRISSHLVASRSVS